MIIEELKNLKAFIVDKYIKSGKNDKDLLKSKRTLDEIIKRKLKKERSNYGKS